MRIKGHVKTGICLGGCVGLLMNHYNYDHNIIMVTALASAVGAVAPDFMEMGIIKHRTWTHWPVGWILLLVGSYFGALNHTEGVMYYYGLGGFCIGALLHVLADSPYYKGTPLIHPRRRLPTLQLEFEPRLNKLVEAIYMLAMVSLTLWIIFGQ